MATYYVTTGGSNLSNGLTLGTAWQTVAFAMGSTSPATSDDVIYVRTGTYTAYVQVGRSGTDGHPITIDTYPSDFPGKAHLTTGGALGSIVFTGQTNWTIKNLEISDTSGGAGIYFDDGGSSTSTITVDSCHIHDNNSGDNASGIYLQRNLGTFIFQNNVLHDNFETAGHAGNNASGIVVFGHINTGTGGTCVVRMLHNEVYNEGIGLKVKHPYASDQTVTVEVAYNSIHNIYGRACIEMACSDRAHGSASHTKRYHHNLCINSDAATGPGIKLAGDFGEADAIVDFNTCYSVTNGMDMHFEDASNAAHLNTIRNNIFVPQAVGTAPRGAAIFLETTTTPYNTFNYNCYWNVTPNTSVAYNAGFQTLAVWQVGTNTPDANSFRSDPLFVSGSDFHLQAGSPCRNLASNGNDMGCYELRTETMGPTTGGATSSGRSTTRRLTRRRI